MLDQAFAEAHRQPDLVLSGHVHNYQRFTRNGGLPYVVVGNGGYHNLHRMASDAQVGQQLGDVKLEAFDDRRWGFLRLEVTAKTISGVYSSVDRTGLRVAGADSFACPVAV